MMSPKQNVVKLSHLGCARGEQVRRNAVVRCGDSLWNEVAGTSPIAGTIAVS